MKTRHLLLGVALAAIALAQPLGAADTTATLTVNASVIARAALTVSAANVSFPDANPDTVPVIAASGGPVTVSARGKTTTGNNITLTLEASTNLISGADAIPASAVNWTVAGDPGFVGGALAVGVPVPVGTWTNSGSRSTQMSFTLTNSWSYPVGTYSATTTFTLTAP
jgi:hypothetical protein